MVISNNKTNYQNYGSALTKPALQSRLLAAMPAISEDLPSDPELFSGHVIFTKTAEKNFLAKSLKYPTIVSPIDLPPAFITQNTNLISNLVVAQIAPTLVDNSTIPAVKKFFPKDQIFLADPVAFGYFSDGYVIFGKLNSAHYVNSDPSFRGVKITSYNISNPRIFIQNKSGRHLPEISNGLRKRFSLESLPQNLDINNQGETLFDLPLGQYQVTPSNDY